jgi:TrmH family RNA methyltransferase
VREFLDLKRNRGPLASKAVALEGLPLIRRAVTAGVPIRAVFVFPPLLRGDEAMRLVAELQAGDVQAFEVSERTMRRMADREGPDGLTATASWRPWRLSQIAVGPATRLLVVEGFAMPGNLGSVVRCTDGAGAAAVVVVDSTIRPTHPAALRASMGTVFSMPVVEAGTSETWRWLRGRRFHIVAADPGAPRSYRDIRLHGAVAIVVGSEHAGLSPFWRRTADDLVSIPMLGVADSLNVGHAAALLLYEALHQQSGH